VLTARSYPSATISGPQAQLGHLGKARRVQLIIHPQFKSTRDKVSLLIRLELKQIQLVTFQNMSTLYHISTVHNKSGQKLYAGRVDEMINSYGFFQLKTKNETELISYLEKTASFGKIKTENGIITVFLKEDMQAEELNKILFEKGIVLSHLVKRKESLEEQFLTLTKNQSN